MWPAPHTRTVSWHPQWPSAAQYADVSSTGRPARTRVLRSRVAVTLPSITSFLSGSSGVRQIVEAQGPKAFLNPALGVMRGKRRCSATSATKSYCITPFCFPKTSSVSQNSCGRASLLKIGSPLTVARLQAESHSFMKSSPEVWQQWRGTGKVGVALRRGVSWYASALRASFGAPRRER